MSGVHTQAFSHLSTTLIILAATLLLAGLILIIGIAVKQIRRTKHSATQQHEGVPALVYPPPLPDRGLVSTWWCRPTDLLGMALMAGIFILFGFSAASSKNTGAVPEVSPGALIFNIGIFATLVAAVAISVHRRVGVVQWLGLNWRGWPHLLWIGPCAVIVMWTLLGMLQYSGYIAWLEKIIGGSSTQDAVKMMRESKDELGVALMCFSASIVAPFAEETIFRGYLYPIAKKFGGPVAAMLFSSLLFAAGHGNVPLLLPLFLLGMLMAFAYEKTGSLWSSISIHFFFNTATVLMQLAARYEWIHLPEQAL